MINLAKVKLYILWQYWRNNQLVTLQKPIKFMKSDGWLGLPKYLLIFNYGIGIKTGIHFQLRNWLRNWEFGPKVAKIAKFLQNSWQAWICEIFWCHFFHFNAKFKSFNNRILKRKKFRKYIFLKSVKIAQFLAKSGQF